MIDRLRGLFKIGPPTESVTRVMIPGQPQWATTNFEAFAREGYRANPYVYACIEQLASAVAGVPWRVMSRGGASDETALDRHPLLDLLARPNPRQGRTALFRDLTRYLYLHGNAYLWRSGAIDVRRPPTELYCVRPDRIEAIPGETLGEVAGWIYRVNGREMRVESDLVHQFKLFDPCSDLYGMSPLQPGGRSVDQSNESKSWNVSLLQNAARPPGALATERSVSDAGYARLKAQIRDRIAGSKNAGEILILEEGLRWMEMGLTPLDMYWLEGQKLSAREIAIVFAVPPELIGDSENKTYSNWAEARRAFYQETILPLLDYIRDELNNWLIPLFGRDVYLDYDSDQIEALQEDRDALWARVSAAYQRGLLTRNEARGQLGLSPTTDPAGDEFMNSALRLDNLDAQSGQRSAELEMIAKGAPRSVSATEISIARAMEGVYAETLAETLANMSEIPD